MRKHFLLLPLIVSMCGCGEITVEFSGENSSAEKNESEESSPSDGVSNNVILYETVDGMPIVSFMSGAYTYIFGQRGYSNNSSSYEMNSFGAHWVEDNEKSGKREMVFDDEVTHIGKGVFQNCQKLMKMTLSQSVETIDAYAFYCCEKLISIDFPSEMKKIGGYAFQACRNLTEINFPSGLNEIGVYAFAQTGLRKIELKSQVNTIEGGAFMACDQLTEVIMHEGLKWIGVDAFKDCEYLSEVTLPESIIEIGNNAFSGCQYGMSLYIKSLTPPRIPVQAIDYKGDNSGIFDYSSFERVTIYVPAEAIDAYSASNWRAYNLVEYDFNAEGDEE